GCVAALAAAPAARAQDVVTYHDRTAKKDVEASGAIVSESPSKVTLKATAGGATKEIPASDIQDVFYEVSPRYRPDYRAAKAEEKKADTAPKEEDRKKAVEEALKAYQKLQKDLAADRGKFAPRHMQYKVARLLARQAEDDPSQAAAALDALAKYRKEHPDSWQVLGCTRTLARLQRDKGDFAGAQKTYEELAALPGVGKEVKQECDLQVARVLIRGKQFADAEQRLKQILNSVDADDPQAVRARVHLAECLGASKKLDE